LDITLVAGPNEIVNKIEDLSLCNCKKRYMPKSHNNNNKKKYNFKNDVGVGAGPQISECTRSKGELEKEVLLLKDNADCLAVSQETQ
jgi:hypothetical protein